MKSGGELAVRELTPTGRGGGVIVATPDYSPQPDEFRALNLALFARKLPAVAGLDVAARCLVSRSAGHGHRSGRQLRGRVRRGAVGLACGAIYGNGFETASFALMSKYMLRAIASSNPSPASVVSHLNRALLHTFRGERSLGLIYARYEPGQRKLALCNCGSSPPILLAGGLARLLQDRGPRLGEFEVWQRPALEITLTPGDVFVAYTDGIAESRRGREILGPGPLVTALQQRAGESSAALAGACSSLPILTPAGCPRGMASCWWRDPVSAW
ncbi:MAG: PP2C family protein-serine/threonine phosphatase [Actinomycetota bacterium]